MSSKGYKHTDEARLRIKLTHIGVEKPKKELCKRGHLLKDNLSILLSAINYLKK